MRSFVLVLACLMTTVPSASAWDANVLNTVLLEGDFVANSGQPQAWVEAEDGSRSPAPFHAGCGAGRSMPGFGDALSVECHVTPAEGDAPEVRVGCAAPFTTGGERNVYCLLETPLAEDRPAVVASYPEGFEGDGEPETCVRAASDAAADYLCVSPDPDTPVECGGIRVTRYSYAPAQERHGPGVTVLHVLACLDYRVENATFCAWVTTEDDGTRHLCAGLPERPGLVCRHAYLDGDLLGPEPVDEPIVCANL